MSEIVDQVLDSVQNSEPSEVVIEETTIKVILKKNTINEKFYSGKFSNMDFQSSGE